MSEKIPQSKPRKETLGSRPRLRGLQNAATRLAMVVVATGILCGAAAKDSSKESPRLLVLRSRSFFSQAALSIDLRPGGRAELRTCDSIEALEACSVACKTKSRLLAPNDLRQLGQLANEAKLFDGRSTGAQLDLAFRSLEVWGQSQVTMLVTTLNPSFSEAGPRKRLLIRLIFLERDLIYKN